METKSTFGFLQVHIIHQGGQAINNQGPIFSHPAQIVEDSSQK